VKFRALIDERYIEIGICKERMLSKLHVEIGVSRSSIRAAYNGTRVSPESADALESWAARVHKVELDKESLVCAPPAVTGAKAGLIDWGKRAADAIAAAVRDAAIPDNWGVRVTLTQDGTWAVLARDVLRGTEATASHADLSEALRMVRGMAVEFQAATAEVSKC